MICIKNKSLFLYDFINFDRYISMKYESKIISFSCIVSMIAAVIIIPSANAYTPYPTLTTKVLHSSEYYQMIGTDWSHDTLLYAFELS